MTARLWLLFVVALALVLAGVWHLNAQRGPSCEERGGQRVQTGLQSIYVGKNLVLVPQYRCEGKQS